MFPLRYLLGLPEGRTRLSRLACDLDFLTRIIPKKMAVGDRVFFLSNAKSDVGLAPLDPAVCK